VEGHIRLVPSDPAAADDPSHGITGAGRWLASCLPARAGGAGDAVNVFFTKARQVKALPS
jgi:hypothetical protein